MFNHFWLFLQAVWGHAVTLAAGCIVTVVLGIIEKRVLKRPISLRVEIGILLAFVFFACFQAWQDEYERAQKVPTVPTIQVTIPPIVIPPAQVVVTPSTPSQAAAPKRGVLAEFENMSNDELSVRALAFVAKLRNFLNDYADQQATHSLAIPRPPWVGRTPTEEEKKTFDQVWNTWNSDTLRLYQREHYEFDAQYQVDAARLRDAMLERLPYGSRGQYYPDYEVGAHTTTFELAYIAADLQRLANEVKALSQEKKK